MFSLTPKENYMRIAKGECPEWVPFETWSGGLPDMLPPTGMIGPSILNKNRTREGGTDIWGVEYQSNYETNYGALPKPGKFILTDIRKWRDVIKAPDYSDVDWELMAKRDYENSRRPIDRTQQAVSLGSHNGYFQALMAFMGFTEGLCAMYEEPEEVKALFQYLSDFYAVVIEKSLDAYKPDLLGLGDDMATKTEPFVSVEMYRELVKPFHARDAKFAVDRGIPVGMHNCGHCDSYVPDYVEIGFSTWNPAEPSNDLVGIKKTFGNKFAIFGGWQYFSPPLTVDKINEEWIRESVAKAINELAPGGGYGFMGGVLGLPGDPVSARINEIVKETAVPICLNFYK